MSIYRSYVYVVSALLRRLARKGLYRLFQAMLTLEKEKYGLRYVPAEAVGYAVVCPLYARSYAEEKEVAVFTRALLDRVRYAEALKLVDVETLTSVVRRAARGDRRAMESLLEVGRGLAPQEVEKIFPELLREFQHYSRAARGEAPSGPGEEAYHFYKYAEQLSYAGFADLWNNVAIYSVAGVAADYVYIFKYNKEGVEYSVAKTIASAEGDVAAKIWRRPRAKLHIQERGKPPKLTFVEPKDPEPHYKALLRGQCRKGRLCPACPLRNACECLK
jgi:hypothetical protein